MHKVMLRWTLGMMAALMLPIAMQAQTAPAPFRATCFLDTGSPAAGTVRITILGDSIDADEPVERPIQGWGTYLQSKLQNAKVANCASSGRSTKTYMLGDLDKTGTTRGAPKFWNKAQTIPADYWLIKFGGNDSHPSTEDKHTEPAEYAANLKIMIETARKLGIKPILVTPPDRPPWLGPAKTDSSQYSIAPYAVAARSVAKEENVPLIDMFAYSHEWYASLGTDGLKKYVPMELGGHLNRDGANLIAEWVAEQTAKIVPQLKLAAAAGSTK